MPKRADYLLIHNVGHHEDTWEIKTDSLFAFYKSRVIEPDSKAWFEWLNAIPSSFSFYTLHYHNFTARKEKRGERTYWYAYVKWKGIVLKKYLGKTEDLTGRRLNDIARLLWLMRITRLFSIRYLGYLLALMMILKTWAIY